MHILPVFCGSGLTIVSCIIMIAVSLFQTIRNLKIWNFLKDFAHHFHFEYCYIEFLIFNFKQMDILEQDPVVCMFTVSVGLYRIVLIGIYVVYIKDN